MKLSRGPVKLDAGDRIVFLSNTSVELLEAFLAASACQAIFVPLNTRWTANECEYAVQLTEPKLVVYHPDLSRLVPKKASDTPYSTDS